MRLIGNFDTEREAYAFYSFLLKEGVQNIYELYEDVETAKKQYRIWVHDEDAFPRALELFNRYKENPQDPYFSQIGPMMASTPPPPDFSEIAAEENSKWRSSPQVAVKQKRPRFTLTYVILMICVVLFLWNDFQEDKLRAERGSLAPYIFSTSLQQALLFDYPQSFQQFQELLAQYPTKDVKDIRELPPQAQELLAKSDKSPSWQGIYPFFKTLKQKGWAEASKVPLFEKIRQGEVWRLFTPCLMHHDFLHILFNMAWLWILGKQIEERIRASKMLLMILIIGIVANVAQYLVSGPYFLGFSGVIVGMAGFIWMRQRLAPWEGYPLNRSTLLFLLIFVLSMFALELVTFALQAFSVIKIAPVIANTAHIVGGLCGIVLARIPFFKRGLS